MADYADTAFSGAPSKHSASSPSFDASESPVALDSPGPHAPEGEPAREPGLPADGGLRQGTLSGFETPEPAQTSATPGDEGSVASPVAGATAARRATRAKRPAAPAVDEAGPPAVEAAQDAPAAPGAAIASEPSFAADNPERVEAVQPDALTQRLDALHGALQGALAGQRVMAAASSRQLKWVLAAASAAVLASVGFGIAQSVRLDSMANEARAEQARLEQFILKQQSTLDQLTQRLATPVAAVAPSAAAAPPAPGSAPAPAHRALAHPAHGAAHAHHAQRPGQKAAR
ncbi:hypothetical protein [Paraburkholderia lycopersici]|uniref:Uncharacterized protein n=1 Tax=Paraburkholderia lycopersici TaxID=416944 RepID=A0A1G7AWW7_9BURK|nr:hypothetical protein [Paraburkholderia lycopersici]SDE19384.1 hypothetical protein SAMN05421548_13624 [Paraburkholderia lycopersici]